MTDVKNIKLDKDNKKMHVAIISLVDYTTSSGRRNFFLGIELVKLGHKVDFISFCWGPKGSKRQRNFYYRGVKVKNLYIRKNLFSILFKGTWELFKNLKADYYILNKALPIHSIPFLIAKKFRKGKVIYDCDDWEGLGGAALLNHVSLSKRLIVTFLEEYIPRKCQGVFGCSHVLVKRHKDMGIKNVLFVPNVVNKEDFEVNLKKRKEIREKYSINEKEILFVHMGVHNSLMDEESLSFFIRAISKVKKSNFKIMIIGEGIYTDKIKLIAKKYDLFDKIIFTGKLPYGLLSEYLSAADVAFIPQLMSYPYTLLLTANNPRKMYELMAMGLPVLASKMGELEYAIQDERMLFNPFDEKELSQKIKNILNMSKKELKEISDNNLKRIEEEFNFKIQAKKVEDFIKKI